MWPRLRARRASTADQCSASALVVGVIPVPSGNAEGLSEQADNQDLPGTSRLERATGDEGRVHQGQSSCAQPKQQCIDSREHFYPRPQVANWKKSGPTALIAQKEGATFHSHVWAQQELYRRALHQPPFSR